MNNAKLFFIDSAVQDAEHLVEILKAADADTEIILLERDRNGIEQIAEILKNRRNLASIQIISHGSEGELQLGTARLSQANLEAYRSTLETWGQALTETGDILLYGCSVASGAGQEFVQSLSAITGADIAASDDLTGNAVLGGDWDLEVQTGEIAANSTLSSEEMASYNYTLDFPSISIRSQSSSRTEGELAGFVIQADSPLPYKTRIFYSARSTYFGDVDTSTQEVIIPAGDTYRGVYFNINDNNLPQSDRTLTVSIERAEYLFPFPFLGWRPYPNLIRSSAQMLIIFDELKIGIERVQDGVEGKRLVNGQVVSSDGLFKLNFSKAAPTDFTLKLPAPAIGTGDATRGATANPDSRADYRLFYRYQNDSANTRRYLPNDKDEIPIKQGDGVGDKQIFIGVEVFEDDIFEQDEFVSLSLQPTDKYNVTQSNANLTIQDNEPIISIGRIVQPSEGYGYGSTIAGLGKALQLEKSKTVEIANSPSLNPAQSNQFTVELWLSVNSFPIYTNYRLVGFEDNTLKLSLTTEGFLIASFVTKNGQTVTLSSKAANQTLAQNKWNHVAATFDGTTFRLLINGQEVVTNSSAEWKIRPTNSKLLFGDSNNRFLGMIDEVRFWETARTQAQLQQNLLTDFSDTELGLVGYWQLNGDTKDTTSNANHGQLNSIKGLQGDYESYTGSAYSGFRPSFEMSRTDFANGGVQLDFGSGSPAPNQPSDQLLIEWNGYLVAPVTGTYTFYSVADDWVRLKVNNQTLISFGRSDFGIENKNSAQENKSSSIFLEAGQFYQINLVYEEVKENAKINLSWEAKDASGNNLLSKQLVTSDNLRQTVDFLENPAPQIGYVELLVTDRNGNPKAVEQSNGLWVRYNIEGGTAKPGLDFYNSQFQISTTNDATRFNGIVIPKGESSGKIYLGAIPDAITEGNETIDLKVIPYNIDADPTNPDSNLTKDNKNSKYALRQAIGNGIIVPSLSVPTINIQDSQGFQPGLAVYDSSDRLVGLYQPYFYRALNNLPVKDSSVNFKLRLTSQPNKDATVTLNYQGQTLIWTDKNWESLQNLTLSGVNGTKFKFEPTVRSDDPKYNYLADSGFNLDIGTRREDYLIVAEDPRTADQAPVIPEVSIVAKDVLVENEPNVPATFTIRLSDPAPVGGLSIPYRISSGNAILNTDFKVDTTFLNTIVGEQNYQITIPEGEQTASFTVSPIDDTLVEGRESFQIELLPPDDAQKYRVNPQQKSATVAILDDDRAGIEIASAMRRDVYQGFQTPTTNPLAGITTKGTIAFVDLDRDGDQDAFVIDSSGVIDGSEKIHFFRNTDSSHLKNQPQFVEQKDQLIFPVKSL